MNKERLVQTFLELVQIDSETRNERGVADYVTKKLQRMGYDVSEDKAGEAIGGNAGNVVAFRPGTAPGKRILFCAHMDTVTPGNGVQPIVEGDVIRSQGDTILGGDDKGGIAVLLEAAQTLQEEKIDHGSLHLVFTIAEEGGLNGAKNIDRSLLHGPIEAAFFLDSDDLPDKIVIEAPIQVNFEVIFHGKAAHAGCEPEKGISAIQMAAEAISNMQLGRIDEETTANIGIIQGGRATNIITDKVVIEGECRSLDRDKLQTQQAHMVACCEEAAKKFGGQAEVIVKENYPGILLDPESVPVKLEEAAARKIGMEPELIKIGGGSDANIFNGYGIPSTVLGVGMQNVHSTEEYITVSAMMTAVEAVLAIIEEAKN